MNQSDKLEALRNDIGLEISKLQVSPGDTLIVRPRNENYILPNTYVEWLKESLLNILPGNINILILPDNRLEFICEKP